MNRNLTVFLLLVLPILLASCAHDTKKAFNSAGYVSVKDDYALYSYRMNAGVIYEKIDPPSPNDSPINKNCKPNSDFDALSAPIPLVLPGKIIKSLSQNKCINNSSELILWC
jgi:hypothetical protein